MVAVRFLATLAVLGVPVVFAPLLVHAGQRIPMRARRFVATFVCVIPLAAPWFLTGIASRLTVWLVTIAGGIVMLKAIDWLARPRCGDNLVRVWLALSVWPALQIEDVAIPLPGLEARVRLALWRFVAGSTGLITGLALAAMGQRLGIPDRGFLLDSIWKTLEIYLLAGGGNHLLVGSFALVGFQLRDDFRYPILPHSILEFWSKYNVLIHGWLKTHIFEPIGRQRRRPVLGILAVFATSGLLHEYLFLPVDRDLLGWQLGFFLLHGSGAIGSARIGGAFRRVFGIRTPRALAIAATVAFIILTMPPFIHCLDRVADLHRGLGAWVLRAIE